jgi:hypothetical protein
VSQDGVRAEIARLGVVPADATARPRIKGR